LSIAAKLSGVGSSGAEQMQVVFSSTQGLVASRPALATQVSHWLTELFPTFTGNTARFTE
jgi:hypothetical protein